MFNNVNRFVKKISKVKVESFSEELLSKINYYLDRKNTKVRVNKNELNIESDNDVLKVLLEKNGISYSLEKDNVITSGKYIVHNNGYFVKLVDQEVTLYDLEDKYSHNVDYKEVFKVFNKDGVEKFRRVTEKVDNYYENKETGEITLHEPDIMENYTENNYMWRVENQYIITRKNRNYIYPDGTEAFINIRNSDDCYIRYQLVNSNTKEIPDCGGYYGIDNNVFFNYFQKKADIGDVIENFHSKKYIKHSVEF